MPTRLLIPLLLLLIIGCAPRREYQVVVHNQTQWPLTIGLVKDGGPYERDLASVGQWAVEALPETLPPWGIVVPPGKTTDTRVSGTFPHGVELYLRVYRGQHSNIELMSMNETGFSRMDVVLFPGANELTIQDKELRMEFVRVRPVPR